MNDEMRCRNCEQDTTDEDKLPYFWRKVKLYEHDTTRAIEGVEIYCGLCHRTITVLPVELFPAAEE